MFVLGRPKEAKVLLKRALAERADDYSYINGLIYYNLGLLECENHRVKQGIIYYEKSLKCKITTSLKAEIFSELIYNYTISEEFEKAEFLIKKAKCLEQSQTVKALINFGMGILYLENDNLADAQKRFCKAHELFMKRGDLARIVECENMLGLMSVCSGDLNKAVNHYNNVLRMSVKLNKMYWIASAYVNLAEVYWYIGNLKKAKKYLKSGRDIENRCFPRNPENATTSYLIAEVLTGSKRVNEKNWIEAKKEIINAFQKYRPKETCIKLWLIAKMIQIEAHFGNHAEVKKWIFKGNRLKDRNKSLYDIHYFYLYTAEYYLSLNELDEAEDALNKSKKYLKRRKDYSNVLFHYLRCRLYMKKDKVRNMNFEREHCVDLIMATSIKPKWARIENGKVKLISIDKNPNSVKTRNGGGRGQAGTGC